MSFRFLTMFLLAALCLGCQPTSAPASSSSNESEASESEAPNISPNENKGLQSVIAHYGGQGHFYKGTTPATSTKAKTATFEIELSNSKLADEQKQAVDFTASNMAYLFYKELTELEQKQYDEIHSIVILSDGQKTTTKFPVADLDIVLKKMKLLERVVDLIKAKDYNTLSPMINNKDLVPFDKDALIKNLKEADADYGDITSFLPFGFRRKKTTDGQRIIHLSGYLIRTKKNNEFSIDVAMDGDKEEVYLLQYVL